MLAWHFTKETLRNGEPIPAIGEWLEFKGEAIPCEQGLHASRQPFDALQYAPGNLLHLVDIEGNPLKFHGNPEDKIVGNRRKIIASIDAESILRKFACDCAMPVRHLWNMPKIVEDYLTTQNPALREAARVAAWVAVRDGAWEAARVAAWVAARYDAWEAAREAAWVAAREAYRQQFNNLIYAQFKAYLPCIS